VHYSSTTVTDIVVQKVTDMTSMQKILLAGVAAMAIGASSANAALVVTASVGGAPTGVVLDNLDALALTPVPGSNNQVSATGIAVNLTPNARVVNGGVSGQFAAPFVSGSNGAGFGNAPGVNTTNYITSGSTGSIAAAAAELILPAAVGGYLYFGLLWGSIDDYNTLSFYDGNTLVGTVTGVAAASAAGTLPNGNQGNQGTAYVNITSSLAFTRVVATSTAFAFEFDNVAYNQSVPVPEPASLALLGLGLLGLGFASRAKRRAA